MYLFLGNWIALMVILGKLRSRQIFILGRYMYREVWAKTLKEM